MLIYFTKKKACFAPGNLLLAARTIPELTDIEELASDMMHGCYNAWTSTRTGIAPEVFAYMDEEGNTVVGNLTGRREYLSKTYGVFPLAPSYILRPGKNISLFFSFTYYLKGSQKKTHLYFLYP